MHYDFDEIVDRSQNDSIKLEDAKATFGRSDIIPLSIADMDFKTAPCIVEAIKARADQGIFGYTWRCPEYFDTIANWQRRRNGWAADPALMGFVPGVVAGIQGALLALTSPGDKVLIQPPVYHPFAAVTQDCGRELVENPLVRDENGRYALDLNDFEDKLKQGVRLFILCNPHNPVGRCWTPEELRAMGELCVRYGVEIISDEIHGDLMLDGHKHTCMASLSPEIAAHTCTCIAPSKTFNLAGLQAGTVVFNSKETLMRFKASRSRGDVTLNNCFSLVATMAAYQQGEDWLEQLLVYLSGNMAFLRDFCAEHLPELVPNTPEATYLNWVDARALGMDDEALAHFCAHKAGVSFNRGDGFGPGGRGFLRVNCACSRATLEKAFHQLERAIHSR